MPLAPSQILNHLPLTKVTVTNLYGPSLRDEVLNSFVYCGKQLFPFAGALTPRFGISLRMVTDLTELFQCKRLGKKVPPALINTTLSAISVYSVFFAPVYFQHLELLRSTLTHLMYLIQGNREDLLHLSIDLVNLSISFSNSYELKIFSHAIQIIASITDFFDQWNKEYGLGAGMQTCLLCLRVHSLYKEIYPMQPTAARQPSPIKRIQEEKKAKALLRLQREGSGSDELKKLTVLEYRGLGKQGELFKVQDEQGNIAVLKRFFKPHASKAEKHLEFSQTVNNPHILRVLGLIRNCYEKGTKEVQDTYLLMEHFEGSSLTVEKSLTYKAVAKIVEIFRQMASLDYFYTGNLHDIKIDKSGENIRFARLESFEKATTPELCQIIYTKMHDIFRILALLSPFSEGEKNLIYSWIDKIFTHTTSSPDLLKKVVQKSCDLLMKLS